jgi:hypothetical protein
MTTKTVGDGVYEESAAGGKELDILLLNISYLMKIQENTIITPSYSLHITQ